MYVSNNSYNLAHYAFSNVIGYYGIIGNITDDVRAE